MGFLLLFYSFVEVQFLALLGYGYPVTSVGIVKVQSRHHMVNIIVTLLLVKN